MVRITSTLAAILTSRLLSIVTAFQAYSSSETAFYFQHQSKLFKSQKNFRIQPHYSQPEGPPYQSSTSLNLASVEDTISELSEERRSTLFQSLLRDLQIEGIPLLGCDADAVHTMSAALWTTMAEISEKDDGQKVCLIMETIPTGALKAFVEDFIVLKSQTRLMNHLPELERFSVSLVGKGVGPAFIIETRDRTDEEIAVKNARVTAEESLDATKCENGLRAFIERIVIGAEACPYTRTTDLAAVGLEKRGVPSGPVGYRFGGSSDACAAVGMFWNCVCELLATPQEEISTTMLSLPAIGSGMSIEAHDRFAAVMELISRNLCLYRGDDVFGLVHFHPRYERNLVHPLDKPAYGHLPPQGWLRPMLKMSGNDSAAAELTDEELELSNFQRRSPFTAINILRANQLDAANGGKSVVDLDVGNGVIEKASGITTYSRNAIRLVKIGKDELLAGVEADIALTK